MQVIDRDQGLGTFSDGFNKGMQQLVKLKLDKLQQRHDMGDVVKAFTAMGIPQEKAQAFASLPQHLQTEFVKSGMLSALQSPKQDIQTGGPQSALEQSVMQPIQQQVQPQQLPLQPQPQQQPEQGLPDFSQYGTLQRAMAGGMTPEKQQELALLNQAVQQQAQAPKKAGGINFKPVEQAPREVNPLAPRPIKQIPEAPAGTLLTAAQRAIQHKEAQAALKEERAEQHRINKEVAPAYKEINNEYKGVITDDRRLNRMEELVNRGDLTRPRWHSLINALDHGIFGFGVNLHSLETADSQEFNKLSNEFLKNAKNIFGARITDNDVKMFMKMVPDLSQSREGKLAIIHNMKLYNEGIKIKKKASDQVVRENGGKLPFDYEARVEEIAAPALDALASRFTKEERIKAEAPKQESGFLGLPAPELINPLDLLFGR
jgi:hypothetical protein